MAAHLRDSVAQAEIDLDGEFTMEELEECLEKAQFDKACGSDETRNEMFTCGGVTMRQLLLRSRRLSGLTEGKLSQEQGGFRPNRSTTDQIISLHEALERRRLSKRSTICSCVDFRKAFDTAWQDGLWERLWQNGMRGRAWCIIRDAYRGIHIQVLVDGCLTQPVPRHKEFTKETLSPVLFLIFLDALAEMLAEQCQGLAYSPEAPDDSCGVCSTQAMSSCSRNRRRS
eukprot:g80078.t1